MSSSSSTSSTTSIMIAPAPPTVSPARAELVAVRARGLEAVMAVGEHHRRRRRPARGCRRCGRVVDRAELVHDAVGVDAGGEHRVGLELLGEAGREAEAPDRVDVGPRRPEQREPIGLGLGGGAFVGEHARVARLGERERADHAPRVARLAVRVAELHAVRVEAGRAVDHEHARSLPAASASAARVVAVAVVVLVAGEEEPHRVVRRGRLERGAPFLVDHVVGWSGERLEIRAGGGAVVTQAGEGEEVGHGALRVRECRPVVAQHRLDHRE